VPSFTATIESVVLHILTCASTLSSGSTLSSASTLSSGSPSLYSKSKEGSELLLAIKALAIKSWTMTARCGKPVVGKRVKKKLTPYDYGQKVMLCKYKQICKCG
jgi:hypothetical protein